MFKLLFSFLLTIHVFYDFYINIKQFNFKKERRYTYLLLHNIGYWLLSILCIFPFWSYHLFVAICFMVAIHFLIDLIETFIENKNYQKLKRILKKIKLLQQKPNTKQQIEKLKKFKKRKEQNITYIYISYQLIQISCIIIISLTFIYLGYELKPLNIIKEILSIISEKTNLILSWLGIIIIAHRPVNFTIKQLLSTYELEQTNISNNKAGAYIGTLERIIILILLSINQYGAIGFVLTAKSIARYDKISKSQNFAEYYLLGTLLSALFAIAIYFVFI